MKRMLSAVIPLMLLAVSAGCNEVNTILAKRAYRGPSLPDSETALISTRGSVKIARVDGQGCFDPLFGSLPGVRSDSCEPSAEVMPGMHDIELRNATMPGLLEVSAAARQASELVSLDAQPGRVYRARSLWLNGEGWFWIEDDTTGEVVAGDMPPAMAEPEASDEPAASGEPATVDKPRTLAVPPGGG